MRQRIAGQRRNLGGKLDRRGSRCLEEAVVIRQFYHLGAGDVGKFAAAIADIDAPQPRHAIENAIAIAIGDPAAIGAGDDAAAAAGFDIGEIRLRRQMMGDIEPAQFGDIVVAAAHAVNSSMGSPRSARPKR